MLVGNLKAYHAGEHVEDLSCWLTSIGKTCHAGWHVEYLSCWLKIIWKTCHAG